MPVSATWYDDACTIIIVRLHDPWTLADLSAAISESRRLSSSTNSMVDLIWDATETSGAPSNIVSHFMFTSEDTNIPANQGAVIVVVRTTFLKSFVALAKRLLPRITRNMHIVADLPAAEVKIAALRAER